MMEMPIRLNIVKAKLEVNSFGSSNTNAASATQAP